ncbi:hypothetical protein Ami103574_04310 [Aminipila butyrica]|uniref:Uncharacterized protein n=1 Tax=Aminipila butyrica TaxID=433296 RepID=A0A858BUH4_9FIRM|nr:hypothetical protein [Aminipila butyrica]QIB68590.1 hypothetical protein Ami103574_04310 [Aminipila butyrica]
MTDYYSRCAFPKPVNKKKKKLYNGYKDKPNRVCAFKGTPYAERHEIFGGPNRQKSIQYGLQVDLSHEVHERVTNPRTDKDLDLVRQLKEYGQKMFEDIIREQGGTDVEARKSFMHEFGKNYLEPLGREGV